MMEVKPFPAPESQDTQQGLFIFFGSSTAC